MSVPVLSKPAFEHHHNGIGVESSNPRISWRFLTVDGPDSAPAWTQCGYDLDIRADGDANSTTYKVDGNRSVLVPWPAPALESRQSATVRVRCTGTSAGLAAETTKWSEWATVETSLLDRNDWDAAFITSAARPAPTGTIQPLRFRKSFTLPTQSSTVRKARLYITSLGIFDAYIDGKRVSDELLAPGWTSYNHRLAYRTIDVTSLLQSGSEHTLCVEVAEGWYAGRLGWEGDHRYLYVY